MVYTLSPYVDFLVLAIFAYILYWLFSNENSGLHFISVMAMFIARVLVILQIIVWVAGFLKWVWTIV